MAQRAFAHALELDPKSISACLSLAELYRTSGRQQLAEKMLRNALSIDPRHVIANQAHGLLLCSHQSRGTGGTVS
jgi:Tfp pilus assembly protein PilF